MGDRRPPSTVARLKGLARPLLLPALKRLGWGRGPAARAPRVSAGERLRAEEVPSRVSVRGDRTILVNGAPFFPNGLYYPEDELADATGAGLRRLREMGFNLIHFTGGLDSEGQLDRIWEAGLHVWYRPPGDLYRGFDLLKQVVIKFARHPAVLFWEMDDEPLLHGLNIADVKVGRRLVKSLDPYHPVLCNQWLSSLGQADEVRRWARLADVYGFGCYPVPRWRWGRRMSLVGEGLPHSVAVVGALTRLWNSYAPGKPVVPVLQAWAWDCLEDGESAYPTYGECRFMAYQAVINGAKGLHHYGAAEARRPNFACGIPPRLDTDLDRTHEDFLTAQRHNRRFWGYYAKVVGEISRMGGVFASEDAGWAPRLEAESAPGREAKGVECLVKRHLDSDVILIANASDARLTVRVCAPRLRNVTLNSWGRNCSVAARPEGVYRDTLEPFGVRVYSEGPDLLADFSNSITKGDDGRYDDTATQEKAGREVEEGGAQRNPARPE